MTDLYPREKLDEIVNRMDIVTLISEYTPLKKSGRNYKGLCPFHGEKTPSFTVSSEKQVFYCFGCSAGGDLFGFLMKIENLTFPEAVQKLASRTNVTLPAADKKAKTERDNREILYRVNRYAAWYFADALKKPSGAAVLNYLKKRGIEPQTIAEFQLGFAPDAWEGLVSFLKSKKVPLTHAEVLGLTRKRKDGTPYDFFRNRLIFPIIDFEGRIVGFGGRRLEDKPASEEAKYINSPESPVYHKGLSIYGLAQAKKAIRESDEVILVEGYMDLIRLHQAGIKNCIAPLGTALTFSQINTLRRTVERFVLMFDGDSAGRKASERALWLMFEAGIHPRLVRLPDGEDPDSFVQHHGGETLKAEIAKANPAMEQLLSEELKKTGLKVSDRASAVRKLLPLVQALPSELEQRGYLARMAQFLGTDEASLVSLVARQKNQEETQPREAIEGPNPKEGPLRGGVPSGQKISLERILLELYVRDPRLTADILNRELFRQFEDETIRRLALHLEENFALRKTDRCDWLLNSDHGFDPAWIAEVLVASESWPEGEDLKKTALKSFNRWKLKKLQYELERLTGEIQLAELKENRELIFKLLARKNELASGIKELQPEN
ncbi:MAG: DNA primase [Deltaproteobacteria bacterium]|nr:DNA primase [Deltaproteobacteria bacterium]